jgi:hypothetical protein
VVIQKPIAEADRNRDFTTREHAAAISSQGRGPQLPFLVRKIITLLCLATMWRKVSSLVSWLLVLEQTVSHQNKFFFLKASLSLVLSYNYCWE